MDRQRAILHDAREQLLWALRIWTDQGNPLGAFTTRRALHGVIEMLQPPAGEWEAKALADTEQAIIELDRECRENLNRDIRVIPH